MTFEVVGAIAIAISISSMIWNIYNLIKICLLENKICYQKGQIEALIRREPTVPGEQYSKHQTASNPYHCICSHCGKDWWSCDPFPHRCPFCSGDLT